MENRIRSIFKTVTWRIISLITTTIISYIAVGNFKLAIGISLSDMAIKAYMYYIHERAWNSTEWGKIRKGAKTTMS